MKVPVSLSRYATPTRVDCECRRTQLDLEFKIVTLNWLNKSGDRVKEGDIICEAEVEKTFIEIPSPVDGTLTEICVPEGKECDIHNPIGYIETDEL